MQSSVVVTQTAVFNTECIFMLATGKIPQKIHAHAHACVPRHYRPCLYTRLHEGWPSWKRWPFDRHPTVMRSYERGRSCQLTPFIILPRITAIWATSAASAFAFRLSYVPFSSWVILNFPVSLLLCPQVCCLEFNWQLILVTTACSQWAEIWLGPRHDTITTLTKRKISVGNRTPTV